MKKSFFPHFFQFDRFPRFQNWSGPSYLKLRHMCSVRNYNVEPLSFNFLKVMKHIYWVEKELMRGTHRTLSEQCIDNIMNCILQTLAQN